MKKTLIIGTLISAVFVYLSIKGVDFYKVINGFKSVNILYVFITGIIFLLSHFLKSYRWGVILSPLEKVSQLSLFSVTSVGYLVILTIPSRLSEFARPFLISRKGNIKLSSAIGSIFVERVLDSIALLLMFLVVLMYIPLPQWLINTGIIFFSTILFLLVIMIFLSFNRDLYSRWMIFFLKLCPEKMSIIIKNLFDHFVDGFKMLVNIRLILYVLFLSILIWIIEAFSAYFMFKALNLNLPVIAGFALIVILTLGLVIPTAPGFIGGWHLFCVIALALFSVSKTDAMTFAIMFHFMFVGITLLLGLLFLPSNKFSFSDLKN